MQGGMEEITGRTELEGTGLNWSRKDSGQTEGFLTRLTDTESYYQSMHRVSSQERKGREECIGVI